MLKRIDGKYISCTRARILKYRMVAANVTLQTSNNDHKCRDEPWLCKVYRHINELQWIDPYLDDDDLTSVAG